MIDGSWFPAFVAATVAALIATPLLARWSRRHSRRRTPLATAAGPVVGVAAALPFVIPDLDSTLAIGLIAAAWLWAAGQLMERGLLPTPLRRLTIVAAAGMVVAADLRLRVTGVEAADVVVTLVVVWLGTSAWRSAETRDGLLLGWAGIIGGGAGLIAGLGGQDAVTALAAGLGGAALGFLAYVTPPVAARLRTGGALFIGFLAVLVALSAEPSTPAPGDGLAPLLLLALPLLDAALAGIALIRGRGSEGRTLGLVGRWRALGLSRGFVTFGMLAVQLGLTFVAVLVGRGVLDPVLAGAIGIVTVVVMTVPALFARVDAPRGRWPRWAIWLVLLGIGGVVVMSAPAGLALLRSRTDVTAAADAAERGLAAARRGEVENARTQFGLAEAGFARARQRLNDPAVSLGKLVPVLGPNLLAARDLVGVGLDLSQAGRSLSDTADPEQLRIVDATVNLTELGRLQPQFARAANLLSAARTRVDRIDTAFLIAPVEEAIGTLDDRLDRAVRDSRTAAFAARVLPGIMGGEGPRRYFLALQNNAEARATGGFIGSYGDITASGGHLDLGEIERIRELLPEDPTVVRTLEGDPEYVRLYSKLNPTGDIREVNLSPDVPSVSLATVGLLSQAGYGPVSGIVTVDPIALRSILELTGPIRVPDWPEEINADNVVDITLFQEYIVFANDQDRRETFLGDVAQAAWDAFSERDLGSPAKVVESLAKATRGRHITLWFADPTEQRLAERAGADGAIPRAPTDLLALTTQNGRPNKIDYLLRRGLDYELELAPGPGRDLEAAGNLRVTLENTAPAEGLPPYIIGPNDDGHAPGENFTLFSAYAGLSLGTVTLDGQPAGLSADRELDRWVYWDFLSIPSMTTRTYDLQLAGPLRLTPDGFYELALVGQPQATPDQAAIRLRLPAGWRFADAQGLRIGDHGHLATFDGPIDHDRLLRVRLVRDRGTGLWARLQDGG